MIGHISKILTFTLSICSNTGAKLVGVVAMHLASKMEDHNALKMEILVNQYCQSQYTEEQVKTKELDVLRTTSFEVNFPTIIDFILALLSDFTGRHYKEISLDIAKCLDRIKRVSIYFAYMGTYEYKMLEFK